MCDCVCAYEFSVYFQFKGENGILRLWYSGQCGTAEKEMLKVKNVHLGEEVSAMCPLPPRLQIQAKTMGAQHSLIL